MSSLVAIVVAMFSTLFCHPSAIPPGTAGAVLGGAAPIDDAISDYGRTMIKRIDVWLNEHPQATRDERTDWIDSWASSVDVSQLLGTDIVRMRAAWASPLLRDRLLEHARDQALLETRAGFHWAEARALLRFSPVYDRQGIGDSFLESWKAVLAHPAIIEAIRAGHETSWLFMLVYESPVDVREMSAELKALATRMVDHIDLDEPWTLDFCFDRLHRIGFAIPDQLLDALRIKTIDAMSQLMDATDDTLERDRAESRLELLRGAHARNKLVGFEAPVMPFLWSSADRAIESLVDLRGKVIVVDFWATWCAPCVGQFPTLKRITERFEDEEVVVLGVTSLQGQIAAPDLGMVETTEPQREFDLLGQFIEHHQMNWLVVVSEQSVFNADFGVYAIPHWAIIDAQGIVRFTDNGGIIDDDDLIARIEAVISAGRTSQSNAESDRN